ncbi:phosphatase PAP2 family protein [Vibrio nitrifigilis]|uniref:undecaprenyl-diphosphate phosphatase n=1 Tax=Vibrio nitrifigilis TaxID=2789781 RepID=A0ABS0GGD5_9VIBR|nr:phosphatase PAP2 family protein [Vibrio nitrifigilis]
MSKIIHMIENFKYNIVISLTFLLILTLLSFYLYPVELSSSHEVAIGLLWRTISETASSKGAILTLLIFIVFCFRKKDKSWEKIINSMIQLFILLVISLGLKTGIKQLTHSPRPYTKFMVQSSVISSVNEFYSLNHTDKIKKISQMNDIVSDSRLSNWRQEMNYSFPSGHTVFVTLCLLFFGRILLESKKYILFSLLLIWSCSVACSRLWLGMHRPADLYGAVLLENLIFILVPDQYRITQWLIRIIKL